MKDYFDNKIIVNVETPDSVQESSIDSLSDNSINIKHNLKNRFNHLHLNSIGYSLIKEVLDSDDNDLIKKELRLENCLQDLWKNEMVRMLSNKELLSNKYGFKIFISEYEKLMSDRYDKYFGNKRLSSSKVLKEKLRPLFHLDKAVVLSLVMSELVPFCFKHNSLIDQSVTTLFENIGKKIYKEYFKLKFTGDDKINIKNEKVKDIDVEDYLNIGSHLIYFIENNSSLFDIAEMRKGIDNTIRVIIPSKNLIDVINNLVLLDHRKLPMLVNGAEWVINDNKEVVKYGGYLKNVTDLNPLLRSSVSNDLSKNIRLTELLVNIINYMSKIPFKINNDVLDILLDSNFMKDKIYYSPHLESHLLFDFFRKKDFLKVNEISVYNSKYIYDTSIITTAILFRNIEKFYFTFFLDWRGRLYTDSGSLSFQNGDLAKSLLYFVNGDVLNNKGVESLKIYTANLYGNDKLSINDRITWVDKHFSQIIDINNLFWMKSDEPFTALAASLELKKWSNNPDNFVSHLPVLLDATCNGIQHLASMAKDINLASKVNLLKSNRDEDPSDLYSIMIEPIKKAIDDMIVADNSYMTIKNVIINRSFVKRAIMTIPYGVTIKGILEQLIQEQFILIGTDKKTRRKTYIQNINKFDSSSISSNIESNIYHYSDLYKLSYIIYNSLFRSHPDLEKLVEYFKNIIRLLNSLNLPIVWETPAELICEQKYITFEKKKITPSIMGIKRSITYNKPSSKMNKLKQIQGFIPNFIHSMDASNLALVVNEILESVKYGNTNNTDNNHKIFNILTIHDCFGTTPNYVGILSFYIKSSFISIYGKKDFLDKFHEFILKHISNYGYIINLKENIIISNNVNKKYKIPNKPRLGNLDIKKELKNNFSYMVN